MNSCAFGQAVLLSCRECWIIHYVIPSTLALTTPSLAHLSTPCGFSGGPGRSVDET